MTEPATEPEPRSATTSDTGCLFHLSIDELSAHTAADIVLTKLHEVADQITRRNGRIT